MISQVHRGDTTDRAHVPYSWGVMLTSMLATCFLAPALAVSVDGGVQAALYAPGLALVGGLVA
jgi:hypothetical protein